MSDQSIVVTLHLPPASSGSVQTGMILIKRGELATMGEFQYSDAQDIAAALAEHMGNLIDVEASPPPQFKTPLPPPPTLPKDTRVIVGQREGVITSLITAEVDGNTTITYMVVLDGETEPQPFELGDVTLKPKAAAPKPEKVEAEKPTKKPAPTGVEQLSLFS